MNTDVIARKWYKRDIRSAQKYWSNIDDELDKYIQNILNNLKFESLLEIGCNCGNRLYNIAKYNQFLEIVGVDINPIAVEAGNKLFEREGLDNVLLKVKRGEELEEFSDNSFDIVFSSATLIGIQPQSINKVLQEMIRISKKMIILLEMNGKDLTNDPDGTGVFCWPGNWKRDYVSLFNKLGISEEKITCEEIPKHVWSPGGGGAMCIKVKKDDI